MHKGNIKFFLFVSILFLIGMSACRKETFFDGSDAKLEFSTDTVYFDTVFTKLGGSNDPRSVNRRFTVRNPYKESIKTSIRLAGGKASPFRINVDGRPVTSIDDYEILPEDSIYIFVEVTIDPNGVNNPLIHQDSVLFITNGSRQDVKLVAWGQDAYYFFRDILPCNEVWSDQDKPYVIYDYVWVPKNCKLTINPGVNIHAAVGAYIFVEGTLEVLGTKDDPVVFQGARLEHTYKNTPSQWTGIRMLPFSQNNIIRYAEIKNGVVGVEVDSLQAGNGVKLNISNTIIKNMSAGGLIGYTARIVATNVLVANCGQYTFLGELGGNYLLKHCTFATFNNVFIHTKPSFGLSNADYEIEDQPDIINPLTYSIQNCIVWGSLDEELAFFEEGKGVINRNIENSILKTEFASLNTNGNLLNQNPRFKDYREVNYELDTLSPAKDKASLLFPAVTIDLKGELRDAQPDIGAYERKE